MLDFENIEYTGPVLGPRFETAEQCARRLEETFIAFLSCHNLLSDWYLKSSTRKKAMETERISRVDREQLTALVSKGVNRIDVDRAPMPELGFRVSLWNKGKSTDAASFSVKCGLHSTVSGLTNSLVVKLPKSIVYSSEVNVQLLTDLLINLVSAWEPDWGVVYDTNSTNWLDRVRGAPFLDHALWITDDLDKPSAITNVATSSLSCGGTLYVPLAF